MIRLLAKWFIPEHNNTASPHVRSAYGVLLGCVGIVLNLLLFAAKFVAGFLAKAISLQADAFNNLGDAGSSIVSMLGFRLSAKKPDRDHPYGHGRIEYIAGLCVSMAILLMAVSLFRSSLDSLIRGSETAYASHFWLSCAIMLGSILVKLYMFLANRMMSKKLFSPTMGAVSIDSLSDAVATGTVLLCALLSHFVPAVQNIRLDAICGLLVSLFIFYSGVKSLHETMSPLLGKRPDPAFVEELTRAVLSFEGINGVHDVIVHDYGPGRVFVSLHAEVSADADIREIHDVIDSAEKYLSDTYSCSATIHMDPIVTDDPITSDAKERMQHALADIDPRLTLHDFRIASHPSGKAMLFDVMLPYDLKLTEAELNERISEAAKAIDPHMTAVVEYDHGEPSD